MSTITAEATSAAPAVELPSKRVTPQQLERLAARVVSTAGNDPMEIEQPFTGKPLGTVPKCGPDDVRRGTWPPVPGQAARPRAEVRPRRRARRDRARPRRPGRVGADELRRA